MENKSPTAKQFFDEELSGEPLTEEAVIEGLINFGKILRKQIIQSIIENAKLIDKEIPYTGVRAGGSHFIKMIDEQSIVNAYPEEKIL